MSFQVSSAFSLAGRVALVSGGSRGLGRAIVEGFARAGADIVIASRNFDSCAKAAEEVIASTGRRALPYSFHAGHWDEAEGLIDAVYERFGRLDVLVNNAGMSPLYDSPLDITEALFDKVVAVNLKGPFRLMALAGTRMAIAGSGSIINVTSMGAVRPRANILPYAAAKSALNAATIGFAHTFGPDVRVNAIMAGTFMTDVSSSWDPEKFAERVKSFAMARGGQPEEIVGAALYLASDASSYTTGSILTVDGGQP